MPKHDLILNLPGFSIQKVSDYNPLVLDLHYHRIPRCIYCKSKKLRKKSSFIRQVRHESIGHRQTLLRFKAYKFYCYFCKRYFNQQFPGIPKYQRATTRLHQQIFSLHTEGVSQQSLARNFKLGKATIERWFHRYYELEFQEFQNRPLPSVLGIDEHSFNRKQGYATTLSLESIMCLMSSKDALQTT